MKPSEALLVGSTLLRPVPYQLNDGNGGGCALGMIAAAHGVNPVSVDYTYPWTKERPCGCSNQNLSDVVHIFNEHVYGDHTWTIEKLADWMKTKEENSDESSRNRISHIGVDQADLAARSTARQLEHTH